MKAGSPSIAAADASVGHEPATVGRQRQSERITARQIVNVLAALDHAGHIGLSPTHLITIDWALGGVSDSVKATGRFLKLLKDAAASKGWKTAHIWTRETGPCFGDHVHILVHLPPTAGRWLARLKPGWLKRCGAERRQGVSDTRRIDGRPLTPSPFEPVSALYGRNLDVVTRYLLKHCDATVAAACGIASKGACTVRGKRVSVSQNVGPAARAGCQLCSTKDRPAI